MTIWIDADACPVVIREIICRAANRTATETVFVANSYIKIPASPNIRSIQVARGFDIADNEIAARAVAGDLVVTGDIPLAAEVMAKQVVVISTRGEAYSEDTIRQHLNMRDFMDTMRSSGVQSGGPPPLGQAEKQAFANALDRYLTRRAKKDG